jgi:hypothetical protein
MHHRQNIGFSAFVCALVLGTPCSFSANVGKIEPIFSGEQEDFDTDRLLESGKTDLKDFLKSNTQVEIERVPSEKETKAFFSSMGLDRGSVKSGDLDSTDDESGDDQRDSDNDMPGDLFPGEVLPEMPTKEVKPPAQPVVYPEFKGEIEKDLANPVELKKSTMGCPDVLLSSQLASDPEVVLAFTYVYSLCLMELSLQKYLQTEPYLQKEAKGLLGPSKDALRELQRILPSYLVGLDAMVKGFADGHLREVIDAGRQASQQNESGIGL